MVSSTGTQPAEHVTYWVLLGPPRSCALAARTLANRALDGVDTLRRQIRRKYFGYWCRLSLQAPGKHAIRANRARASRFRPCRGAIEVWCAFRMQLHTENVGSGEKVALLLHGMMGSSGSWWRVAPQFVSRGYHVIALDLPGHGLSPRHPSLTIPDAAASVVETVSRLAGRPPTVAMGHSFGGAVLAASIAELAPERAIYVDAPTSSRGGWDRDAVRAEYESDRAARTVEGLRARRPLYSDRDCEVEALAAERFDPETAAGIASATGGVWTPSSSPASLMVRVVPSDYVSDEDSRMLTARGVIVRDIPGAAHSIWYSDFERFMAAIDDWY